MSSPPDRSEPPGAAPDRPLSTEAAPADRSSVNLSPTDLVPADLAQRLISLRRALHQDPELSSLEHRTATRLEEALATLGARDITRVADTGVVARVPGRSPTAPVVAVRGDTDALPIHEETGLSFASRNPGVMHACGHDVHASWAVGAAGLLLAEPAEGDVLIVLQPAEEVADGAARVMASGALDGVRAIFGGHVDRRFPVGTVVAQPGPLAASADLFEIVLRGRGAHGARPQEGRDPVVGAAHLIVALQTLVSRRLDPGEPGVVTVGRIEAGQASNVIPERARLGGTIRATSGEARSVLCQGVEELTRWTARAHGLEATVDFGAGIPPLVNEARSAGWAAEASRALLGSDAVRDLGMVNMAGEDFAVYLESMPGAFLRIGAREPGGEVIPAHSPRFHAAEESLFVGSAVLAETARRASRALASERS